MNRLFFPKQRACSQARSIIRTHAHVINNLKMTVVVPCEQSLGRSKETLLAGYSSCGLSFKNVASIGLEDLNAKKADFQNGRDWMDQPQPRASFLKRKRKSPGDEAGKRQSCARRPKNVVSEFSKAMKAREHWVLTEGRAEESSLCKPQGRSLNCTLWITLLNN